MIKIFMMVDLSLTIKNKSFGVSKTSKKSCGLYLYKYVQKFMMKSRSKRKSANNKLHLELFL